MATFLCLTAMLLSFLMVQFLAGTLSPEPPVDPQALQRARLLRTFTNELVALCNAYHRRIPDTAVTLTSGDRTWLDRSFRPDLQFLEQRMDDTMPPDVLVFVQLRAAAARCSVMGRNPEDRVLRARTLDEVARSVSLAETHIDQLDATHRAGAPKIRPQFP